MNEQIQEFAKEAGFNSYNYMGSNAALFDRFAQLTARELIVDFYRRYLDVNSNEDITVQVERYIKDQFGVEQ